MFQTGSRLTYDDTPVICCHQQEISSIQIWHTVPNENGQCDWIPMPSDDAMMDCLHAECNMDTVKYPDFTVNHEISIE
jgi:hypothetical protein